MHKECNLDEVLAFQFPYYNSLNLYQTVTLPLTSMVTSMVTLPKIVQKILQNVKSSVAMKCMDQI